MKNKYTVRRIIAVACVFAMVLTLVFAAAAVRRTDALTLAGGDAAPMGAAVAKTADAKALAKQMSSLTDTSLQDDINNKHIRKLIIYFLSNNADYYRENGLKKGFRFFDADKYLQANPDVAAAVNNSREGALEHYLTMGALEGRSSCGEFDPIIAITVIPEACTLPAEEVPALWKQVTGDEDTSDYVLSITPDEEKTSIYRAAKKQRTNGAGGNSGGAEPQPAPQPVEKPSFTMMVYLCGTDLESRPSHYDATRSMMKIILGAYDEENVNVMILAGGTDAWKNEYFNELLGVKPGEANKSAIFSVNKDNVKVVVDKIIKEVDAVSSVEELNAFISDLKNWDTTYELINQLISKDTLTMHGNVSTAKMGDASTLVSLLEAAKTGEFKADSYGLSLWNHGGGALSGVCFPEDGTSPLEIFEIRDALKAADFGSTVSASKNKLGLLAFDACLMAGAETAAFLSDYYDMMYASEEATYGDIDYFTVINEANKAAGEKYLAYWLAIDIAQDRVMNYNGTDNLLSTGAVFESGKTAAALTELNNVAAELNKLTADSKNANAVYSAFKNARLKSEQIGSSATRTQNRDYVDMKNFLQTLKAELKTANVLDAKLGASIDKAVEAADQATFATLFNYAGKIIYLNFQDIEETWLDKAFWDEVKGMSLNGASIYVPYYGVDKNTLADDLKYFETHYANNLPLKDYDAFIKKFGNEYLNSAAEKERITKLTAALMKGTEEDGTAVTGYAGMLDMSFKPTAGGEVLSIKVNDYADGTASEYSSGDAFIDLCDTMDTMLTYVTRRASAYYAKDDVKVDGYTVSIDIVVGNKTVSYENLNGLQSTVNIFTRQFADVNIDVVSSNDSTALYDFVVPSDIEGYKQKLDMITAIVGAEKPGVDYLTVKGTAKIAGTDEYLPVYHLFEGAPQDGSSQYKYVYRGSTELYDKDGILAVGEKLDTESITFYHQTVDFSTNRLVYAEEYQWAEDSSNYRILSLCGGKEYATGTENEVVINGLGLSSIGTSADNGYYFAVSQNQYKVDDDVFANDNAKGANYEKAPDVFDAITEAENANAAAAAASADSADKSPDLAPKTEAADESKPADEAETAADAEEAETEIPAEEVSAEPEAVIPTEEASEDAEAVIPAEEAIEETEAEIPAEEVSEEPETVIPTVEIIEVTEEAAEYVDDTLLLAA